MADLLNAWKQVGSDLQHLLESPDSSPFAGEWQLLLTKANQENPWFGKNEVITAFKGIAHMLSKESLDKWSHSFTLKKTNKVERVVGVIMAGNIPMAGFHDMLCVSLSGHRLQAKLSSDDSVLLPFMLKLLASHHPEAASRISFKGNLKNADAIIATGSNNTSRYFEYYFGNKPHIFRKNRNSVAVLTGSENEYDLLLLGRDIFTYYGMGCRNVSKLYVPKGYSFDNFFPAMQHYADVMQHNKYMNNFDYNSAVYLLNTMKFLTNNFLIVIEDTSLHSPVSVVHFEYYENEKELSTKLEMVSDQLQCIVSKNGKVGFGQTQLPEVSDYADGVDTMQFLQSIE
ncbi:MAG TPA: acyl-CoA reductase [Bacteroidia bacterium]|nr:acyl-CoA reductase [Bacteroidia bacterium]